MGVPFAPLTDYTMSCIPLMNHNRSKTTPQIRNFSIESIFFVMKRIGIGTIVCNSVP